MISGCNKIWLVYRRSEIESLQFGTKWEKLCEIIYFVAYTVCYTQLSVLGSSIAIAIMEKLNIDGVSRGSCSKERWVWTDVEEMMMRGDNNQCQVDLFVQSRCTGNLIS